MAYSKTTWVNGTAPPLDATNMNKIETELYNQSLVIDAMADYVTATGSTGYWNYVQYNSGRVEAWYYRSGTTVSPSYSSGDGWYRNQNPYSITLTDLGLSTILYADTTAVIDGYANSITSMSAISTSTISYYVSHLGSLSSVSAQIFAHVVGTV